MKYVTLKLSRIVYPLIMAIGVYIALASSKLAPSPLLFIITTTISLALVLESIRIALLDEVGLGDIGLLILSANISGFIGLLDEALTLMYSLAILLVLIDGSKVMFTKNVFNFLKSNKLLVMFMLMYLIIVFVIIHLDILTALTGVSGLESIRSFITLLLASKSSYMFLGMLIGLSLVVIANKVIVRKSIKESLYELELSLENELYSIGTGQVVVIEFMLILIAFIIYPLIIYSLMLMRLPSGLPYIIGVIVSFVAWVILRNAVYGLISLSIGGENRKLKVLCVTVGCIVLIYIIISRVLGYNLSVFNEVYKSIIRLEIKSIKLLIELLWG